MSNVENGSSTVAPESQAPSLADELSSMFGDGFSGDESNESPETVETPAGAPPAADPAGTPEKAADAPPDGDDSAEHAGAPPADAATISPDDDPLKDAKPFTYTVDGQERTAEGLQVLTNGGAIIPAEHVQRIQQRLSERDHLFEKDKQSFQKYSALEDTFNKLTAWTVGKDAQGNPQVVTGADGLERQRVMLGQSLATLETLSAALDDPKLFASLVDVQQDANGQLYILPNAEAVANLRTRAELAATKAEQRARDHFNSIRSQLPQRGQVAPTPPTAEAPIESIAMPTVEQAISDLKVTGFTAEDKAFFAAQLPRYVRATTPQEKAQNLGNRIVDESFVKLIQREATRRAESSTTVASATQAAQENARRLAQAAFGTRRTTATSTQTPSTTPRVTPAVQRVTDADDAWDRAERAAAAAARQRVS